MTPEIGVAGFGDRPLTQDECDSWTYGPQQMQRLRKTVHSSLTDLAPE